MKSRIKETISVLARLHDVAGEMFDETKKLTILIVDDEEDYLELIARYVSAFGYDCLTAADGEQALARLRDQECDLVITDLLMPNMNGMQLLKRIQGEYPHVPTMILSANGKDYTFKEIIRAGAYEFIEKPVNKDVLEAKIERVFREKMLMASYQNEIKTQKILVELLGLSRKDKPLPELLHDFLRCITSFPWLELQPKGAVLLVDQHDRRRLILTAHHNLSEPLIEICAQVPFGRCLCGLAAQNKEVIFVDHIGKTHQNRFQGMREHGHYCVPILLADGELLGVFTLYVKAGAPHNREAEQMLRSAAQTVASIISNKKNEERNAESEQRYRAMTDNVLDALIMMDAKGRISFWNPAAERIFGYSAAEVIGQNLHALIVPAEYHQQCVSILRHFFKTGQGDLIGKTVELVAVGKDGRTIPVELSLSSLKIHDEWQAVGVVRDVSLRKDLERETDLLNSKLRQAQRMEAIGTLAGGIAHDFNNILGAVIGFADIAREEVPAESQVHADLGRILAAGYRAKDLVHQILTFSRQKEDKFFPTQIQPILKEALKLLRATIPASIEIHQEIDPECAAVMADPTQLHQVIMNLCTNAYHAMRKQGGHLRIILENSAREDEPRDPSGGGVKQGRYVKLTVADSGEGMDPEVRQHIFEPYFTTKPQGEGTGLGLSLVHGIIQGLGGTIEVESEPGMGTLIEIYLPALVTAGSSRPPGHQGPIPGGHEHILLVDDEISLIEVTSRKLRRLGYAVTARASSIEALEAFKASPEKFDLIITDLAMPNMTGLDLVLEIFKVRPETPAILTTGFVDVSVSDYALKIGIRQIIGKPIDLYEVTSAIRQVLSGERHE